jgi:hypothetical protein
MDRERLQETAAEYPYLRGLLAVPTGSAIIVAALGNWQWGPFQHAWFFIAALVVIGLATLPIYRYYNDRFGHVTPSSSQQWKSGTVTALGAVAIVVLSTLLNSEASWSLDLPVNAIAISFALVMLTYYSVVVRSQAHHRIIWGGLLIAGLLPVWDGPDAMNVGLLMSGVCVIVAGIFDHRSLVRGFGRTSTLPSHS